MTILGNQTTGGTSFFTSSPTSTHRLLHNDSAVLGANQVLDDFSINCDPDGAGGVLDIGVYDVTAGVTNAPLRATFQVTIPATSGYAIQTFTGIGLDLAAFNGQTLALALGPCTGSVKVRRAATGNASASTATGALLATWDGAANTSGVVLEMFATTKLGQPTAAEGGRTATKNITVNNPYIYTSPSSPTDGNSIFQGQSFSAGSKHWIEFTGPNADKVTFNLADVETNSLWGNDVNDWLTPVNGFAGVIDVSLHIWDATTSTTATATGTVTVSAANTKPVIALTGASTISWAHGTAFADPGYTATDTEDGNITGSVVVGGTVDINTIGSYVLTYDVTDGGGLAADQVTRTVNVTDQSAPVITLNGDATINIFQGDTYNDAGASVSDNVDAGSTLVAAGSVDVNTVGAYVLTYDYTDAAGNAATQVTRTVNVLATRIVTGTLVLPNGAPPANMTGLSMAIYANAQDMQTNANVEETLTGIAVTSGSFTVNPRVAGVGTHYMRLFNPADYAAHAYGQIEIVT